MVVFLISDLGLPVGDNGLFGGFADNNVGLWVDIRDFLPNFAETYKWN